MSHERSHHGPIPGEIPVPHGVQEYDTVDGRIIGDGDDFVFADKSEKEIFQYLLHPSDSYTPEGVYWADLPFGKKFSFVTSVDNAEVKRELKTIGRMFKADPLSPVAWYFRNCVLPGAGLGLEGYVLFSIGNVSSLFSAAWPSCWGKNPTACNANWINAVQYLEIAGIICGQIGVGLIGDGIGRKWGLVQDAAVMTIGLVMLTASWGVTLNGWVICYAWSLFFYSCGVGGEYPMTATSGMEKGTRSIFTSADDRLHRGRKVTSAFLMQGWGQFFNQVILILGLLIFHHGSGNPPYSKVAVQWTFRVAFAIPAFLTLWLVYYRYYKMPYPSKDLEAAKKKAKVTGYDVESLKLVLTNFAPRLFATAAAWFCNDVFFYGNKLFQSQFIAVLTPSKSVIVGWNYNLINIGVSLCGYYLASFLIDHKFYGRNRMMQLGFLMDFVLFVVPGFHYDFYIQKENITKFQTMYFLSSFFNQFGPNAVTFLVAAEVYPTQVRATAHGISAASGKLGALIITIIYAYVPDIKTRFHLVPWFGLAGMLVTFLFLPDVTALDLREQDRRFEYIRAGRASDYHGIAVHPQHLSLYERWRGIGKQYNPEIDYKQRVDELRKDWEDKQKIKASEDANSAEDGIHEDYSPDVHQYFVRTSPVLGADQKAVDDGLQLPDAASNEKQQE